MNDSETAVKKIMIEIKGLCKSYGKNHVLKGFDMKLYEGENLVVMGKSGSGKSVMIKCLVGLEDYEEGTVKVFGKDIRQFQNRELDELRTNIGFLFQGSALYDSMSVKENLEFPLRHHREKFGKTENTMALVMKALENVGLEQTLELMPEELSGGMKRRIALARALILQPTVMLYDEPTTGLDPITAKEIVALIKSIQEKHKTSSVIITHDLDCARIISNRMILLINGINYAEGTFEQLSASEDPEIQAFFK
ncbi:ABC transporter ATP-binding protein [Flavobacterium sp.]|uniref:ABC transporter ATP-binding protein n=1 Tax=Flavobacterium sp. TaxID=239 RepID=UPI003D6A92A1